ncbi:MAG: ParB/RepB/Spo0J family partition protein [Ignavibacteria bacterium]|nr:ParB/RepB/Spo0J family partition protein [Ignavibacteria bacterium]
MTAKKKLHTGLGKGLGALLPSIEFKDKGFKVTQAEQEDTGDMLAMVDVSKIRHNPYQPRHDFNAQALDDLKNSIVEHGVIQPITLRRAINGYELISGERRLRASVAAGLAKVPAYILDIDYGPDMLELALIENVQREDLNPIEIANGYQRLIEECKLTQEQVAAKVGKDRTTVTNFLRLLRLPEKIQNSLRDKNISMGHARTLLALSDSEVMMKAWDLICEQGLSVRATEKLVKDIELGKVKIGQSKDGHSKTQVKSNPPKFNVFLEDIANQLRHIFGTKVRIHPKTEESGTIELEFYSKDDFERLIDLLTTSEKELQ